MSVICSGDSGVYGMAGLVLELAEQFPEVEIEIVPGVTAASAGAAVLGAPICHDFARDQFKRSFDTEGLDRQTAAAMRQRQT